jgi:hypothetical protein
MRFLKQYWSELKVRIATSFITSRHCNAENVKMVKKITSVFSESHKSETCKVKIKNRTGMVDNADNGLPKTIGEGKNVFPQRVDGR